MTQGLTRAQLGVTDEMIAAYGETVFALSNNLQTRRGDPVREKDFAAIEAHRHELGMGDAEIAARIGLTPAQVTLIRNLEERRRFRTGHYPVLNALGGGRRYREERFVPFQDHFRFSEEALALRAAFSLDPERVRAYVEQGWWGSDTLSGWLRRNAQADPDGAALVDERGTVSNAALEARVDSLVRGLHHAGIRPGDVVAVQLANVREHIEILLAVSALGAVTTTLYMSFRGAELAAQLRHSRARMLVAPDRIGDFSPAGWLAGHREELPHLETAVVVGAETPGALSWERLAAGGPPLPRDWREPTAADPFLLLYTSGTTSSPKGVPLSYHQMLSNARLGLAEHDLRAGDVVLSAAPFGHLYALYSVEIAIAAGAANALLPAFSPPALADALERLRPTHVFLAPAHLAACAGTGLLERMELSSVRLVVLAGAAVPPDLVHALAPRLPNGEVCQLWGMTELQAGLYTRIGDGADLAARSAGRASPGTEVRIADEQWPGGRRAARRASSRRGGPRSSPATSRTPRRPPPRSPRTDGSAPATRRGWTRPATSVSPAASRTSSTGAASSTTRRRSNCSSRACPPSSSARSPRYRTSASASAPAATWSPGRESRSPWRRSAISSSGTESRSSSSRSAWRSWTKCPSPRPAR